jgi:hypothetical protein
MDERRLRGNARIELKYHMRRVHTLLAYAVSCFLLNNVLQNHYFHVCRSSILSIFALDQGAYCQLVDRSLRALQWSPIIVAAPLLLERNRHVEE